MKTLEQIQEENRKAIIMANNPAAKDYDEALEMELTKGCLVNIEVDTHHHIYEVYELLDEDGNKISNRAYYQNINYNSVYNSKFITLTEYELESKKIIGKPITLDRVLIALEPYPNNWGMVAGHIAKINRKACNYDFKCKWDLTKTTLEDQSEETQRAINKLLIK
jgi:hypothetical protein